MNSLAQGFEKLVHYRQTNTQTDATEALPRRIRGWYKMLSYRRETALQGALYLFHTADTDKTRLSCLVLSVSAV